MSTFWIWKALCRISILLAKFIHMAVWRTALVVVWVCFIWYSFSSLLSRGEGFTGACCSSIELELLEWYFSGMEVLFVGFRPNGILLARPGSWRTLFFIAILGFGPRRAPLGAVRAFADVIGIELHAKWLWTAMIYITGSRLQMRWLQVVWHAAIQILMLALVTLLISELAR